MTENDLFEALRLTLLDKLTPHMGGQPFEVIRSYQSTQQGRPEVPTLYLSRYHLHLHGWPTDHSRYDEAGNTITRTSEQVAELQVQVNATLTYNPGTGQRVGDLLGLAARVMQTGSFREAIRAKDVKPLRITDITNGFRVNDRDQFEPVPLFIATYTYTDTLTEVAPAVDATQLIIKAI